VTGKRPGGTPAGLHAEEARISSHAFALSLSLVVSHIAPYRQSSRTIAPRKTMSSAIYLRKEKAALKDVVAYMPGDNAEISDFESWAKTFILKLVSQYFVTRIIISLKST
jgi:hypothetical protein